ncbi:MAG: N-6 DNA methylase, partial [Prevotella sp.]|nr:N-6 DNA methylase [Prevotella sp.]
LPKMVVTNEPAHFECGAPDYIIQREKDHLPVFFVEAKDVNDNDLDGRNKNAHKEQFDRYKQALDYIIFTDYLDFHLYEHGEFARSVRIAEIKGDKIVGIAEAEDKFVGMVQHLGSSAIQRITSAPRLAKLMAGKARLLANIIETALNDDDDSEANHNLQTQYVAFKDALIQELKKEEFADIYAQTIAYGMFAARLHDDTPEDFSREEAGRLIPKTNPFLRKIFNDIAGNDIDERIAWVVDDLVTVFQATNLQELMASYSRDKRHHDPMIHFYEDFLAEYNPKQRKAKGVWYTPQPVVGFIVRAVDEILQKDFGLPEGLADYSMIEREVAVEQSRDKRTTDGMKHEKKPFHRVQILDPATGTGTFLAEVVNQIYDRYRDNQGIWQQYVEQHLLPRLNGFEILMASYVVAHIKLDMLLGETGYQHKSDKRLQVYLTNSLEESNNEPRTLFAYQLSEEANQANRIKRLCPVMVMIGNPPYSVSSQNKGEWINKLLEDYKKDLNERNIQPLSDDYIKFIRLGQYYVEKNNSGILAFISNNGFIDGVIHRQIRKELMRAFDKIYILDLHGNSRKKETAPDGSKDENVFDIMQGVSINIFVKTKANERTSAEVHHYDLYGSREDKYHYLNESSLKSVAWKQLEPKAPQYFFVPKDFASQEEYERGFRVDELIPIYSSGVKTSNDEELVSMKEYNDSTNRIYFYRPFDIQFINYDLKKVGRPRFNVMKFFEKDNLGLLICKQAATEKYGYFVTKGITDINYTGTAGKFGAGLVFPLYAYKENMGQEERIVNFNKDLYDSIAKGLNYLPCYDDDLLIDPTSEFNGVLYPQDLFDYIYAVLHSPSYRERYREFLKIDFPRIPYPTDWEKFRDLAEYGEELRHLHLMEDLPSKTSVSFPVRGTMQVDCYRWEQNRVYINSEQYFEGVPESAWNFYIGGYQPAQKWLKDRKGMTLSFEDVKHYQRIIYVLQQTERIMQEINVIT